MLLYQGHEIQWAREESLTQIEAIELVDLPEKSVAQHQYQSELHRATGLLVRGAVDTVAFTSSLLKVNYVADLSFMMLLRLNDSLVVLTRERRKRLLLSLALFSPERGQPLCRKAS